MGTPSKKADFPGLFEEGLHVLCLHQIRQSCLELRQKSKTRPSLFKALTDFIDLLQTHRIKGELWIDGSFVTEKVDPDDVDLVVRICSDFIPSISHEQLEILQKVKNKGFNNVKIHTFLIVEMSGGTQQEQDFSEKTRRYWLRWFTHDRAGNGKGCIVYKLRDVVFEEEQRKQAWMTRKNYPSLQVPNMIEQMAVRSRWQLR